MREADQVECQCISEILVKAYLIFSHISFDLYHKDDQSKEKKEKRLSRLEGMNGGGGGGPFVGCRLKFSYFVGSRLKFSIFVGSRLNFLIFGKSQLISKNEY